MIKYALKKGHFLVPLFVFTFSQPLKLRAEDYNYLFYPLLGFVASYQIDRNFSMYSRDNFKSLRRFSPLGRAYYAAGFVLMHGIYSMIAHKRLCFERRLILSLTVSGLFISVIKYTFHRTRPNTGKNIWYGPGIQTSHVSFPSGHTQVAFVLASSLSDRYGYPFVFYGMALLVGLSRIAKNMHHLSDVVVGAYSGYYIDKLLR